MTNLRTVHSCYSRSSDRGCGYFYRTLHVAMEIGLYHHAPSAGRVWRIVSEDSRDMPESFLLIARTARIFTATRFVASSGGSTGCSSIQPDFITTVVLAIVTAAVYRGFSLRLRLAADHAL